jgi:hypothetical protein
MTIEDLVTTSQGHVHILHYAHVYAMPLAGPTTVGQARAWLEEQTEVHAHTLAVLDGEEADDDTLLHEGQFLCFVRPAGR